VATEDLRRILSKGGEGAAIVSHVMNVTGTQVSIWDVDCNLLLGVTSADSHEASQKHPIFCDDEIVGWVSGEGQAELVAALLTHLATRETEKEELLVEVLDLYRQMNLLFNFSKKLAASLELDSVAKTTLEEASRLIEATGGAVVLLDDEQAPQSVVAIGQGIPAQLDPASHGGIVGAVVAGARAEIINDVRSDTRYGQGNDSIRSLLCAPLTSKDRTMGAIVLASEAPVTYTAADLSLLNTLASQAAPALESALLFEKTLREAQEREELLRRQVLQLRIELDEARQSEKVAEITGSEHYRRLRDRAETLRSIIGGPSGSQSDQPCETED
jgi:transcriptional regulator with GAF, ATPase, and Fis domain